MMYGRLARLITPEIMFFVRNLKTRRLGQLQLFLLVAVRSSTGVQNEGMARWLKEHPHCVHHLDVAVLSAATMVNTTAGPGLLRIREYPIILRCSLA